MKTTSLAALAVIAIAGSASAATITWQGPQAISASTDVNTQGTVFTAKSTGYGYTVNGVYFDPYAANLTEGFTVGGGGFMGGISYIGTNDTDGQAYAGLMDIAHGYTNAWTNATVTITFSNLTVNQEYLVQYWVADYRGYTNDRTLTLTGGTGTSGELRYLDSDNTYGIHGSYVIGTFVADATSQNIDINSNESTQMNAVQLRVIPEPGAALLGGLGMLALLRRRR